MSQTGSSSITTLSNPLVSNSQTATHNLARRKTAQTLAFMLIWLSGLIAIAAVVWIIGYVMIQGASIVDLEFLTTRPQGGMDGEGGMSTTIVTTLYLVSLTIAIAAPLGIGAAVYLVEYATEASRESIFIARLISLSRSDVEILAGVPSIIFGLFGFALFVSAMKL